MSNSRPFKPPSRTDHIFLSSSPPEPIDASRSNNHSARTRPAVDRTAGDAVAVDNVMDEAARAEQREQNEKMRAVGSPIPLGLLSRIVHDSFRHSDTRATQDAIVALQDFVDVFVREAILRAYEEKAVMSGEDDGFLDVAHLEQLTPQLMMDFS